jgi:nucleotide-binding universal stress UspA family protein
LRIREAAANDARGRLQKLIPDEARTYCTVNTAVVDGRAYRKILRQAAEEKTDLIVMGVHGRGAVDLLLSVQRLITSFARRAARC